MQVHSRDSWQGLKQIRLGQFAPFLGTSKGMEAMPPDKIWKAVYNIYAFIRYYDYF